MRRAAIQPATRHTAAQISTFPITPAFPAPTEAHALPEMMQQVLTLPAHRLQKILPMAVHAAPQAGRSLVLFSFFLLLVLLFYVSAARFDSDILKLKVLVIMMKNVVNCEKVLLPKGKSKRPAEKSTR
ncbi:hypothetical protein KKC34_03600 [bacterium]|nr:hypothetical protein [bacterium]